MPLLSLRTTRLVYPADPRGIDPAHPATGKGGARFSVVSSGAGFVNLFNGLPTTAQSTPSAAVNGVLGPVVKISGGQAQYASLITQGTNKTAAGFVQFDTLTGSYQDLVTDGDVVACLNASGVWNLYASADHLSSATAAINTPYFFCMSIATGKATNILIKNLRTGATITTSATTANTTAAGNNFIVFGNNTALTQPVAGGIAAAMFSPVFLSMPQMQQWAQDPWSFWCPPQFAKISMLLKAAAAAVPTARAGTMPLMGVG